MTASARVIPSAGAVSDMLASASFDTAVSRPKVALVAWELPDGRVEFRVEPPSGVVARGMIGALQGILRATEWSSD